MNSKNKPERGVPVLFLSFLSEFLSFSQFLNIFEKSDCLYDDNVVSWAKPKPLLPTGASNVARSARKATRLN